MTALNAAHGKLKAVVAALILAFLAAVMSATAQTNESSRILFLELRLNTNSVSLVRAAVRQGVLKPSPPASVAEVIHFDLASADGQVLWQATTEDPRSRVLEFEDPPRSGKLKRKIARFSEIEFTVRMPLLPGARRVEFYTLEKMGGGQKDRRTAIGSIPLPTD